ncbi:MAG TPA: ATP-binding protein [Alphaproteobacteria bacterium]|nr:ATP-binding protein [Alphaproteobacteria bacterium]
MDGSSRGKPGREVAVSGWKLGLARMIGLAPEPPLRKRNWPDGVLDDAPVGIAITSLDGKILQSNRTLAALLGVAVETMAGRQVDALFAAASRGAVQQMRASGRGADMPASIEARLAADGRERVVLLHCRPVPPPAENEPGALALYFVDLTDQKNLEAQFAQSQKMQAVGQLAGGIAHDFNNLLTAMIGFCDLLLLRHKPGDPSFGDIMQIKQNANRAANLVRQLLAFSRQQTLQPRFLDITDVLAELTHLLRRLIGENIELDLVHGRDMGLIKVDQGQLEQVLINLAVNARDAMPDGGKLTISTAARDTEEPIRQGLDEMPPGRWVSISVKDTGIGIPKENLARIFEPFFSTKEIGSGTGLGLSTVYGIVRQTGGFVFVDSAPGQGATFTIYLPRHEGTVTTAESEAVSERTVADLTGVGGVLLVEDEDAVRSFSARALRNKGYVVWEANSGEAALALFQNEAAGVDLMVTDVIMPSMDGPSLARKLREARPNLKVIFISGYTEDRFSRHLDLGAGIHFLPKPFSLKQLASKVKEVMQEDDKNAA